MEIDFAILYFGLTRSTSKVYESHFRNIFDVLDKNNLSYKKFIHTWKTSDNKQRVGGQICSKEIDYTEYKLLNPDHYNFDCQCDFLKTVDMNDYYNPEITRNVKDKLWKEWRVGDHLVKNSICSLESQKRCFKMMEDTMASGFKYKYIMFVRPDINILDELPIKQIIDNPEKLHIPDFAHCAGVNDRFAISNYTIASIYGKRLNEMIEFIKLNGYYISEKFLKYVIDKHSIQKNLINFNFNFVRP